MTALAGELADIALVTTTPVSVIPGVSAALRSAADLAGREPGSVELAARVWCIPGPEEAALARAREWLGQLLGSPPYIDFYASHGWGEALAPAQHAWVGGDRKRGQELIPESFLREVMLLGSPTDMKAQMRAFVDAGLDTLVLAPVCAPSELPVLLATLAPEHVNE
jgi:alkanesulfonate monooxygenase SsuD/methylene tetrahydromethanopterin reductase-like flavin-dependent oxidoreductase (luciferase family)